MKDNLKITTINDEISPNLEEVIAFLKDHKIRFIELRTINKKNLIDFSLKEVQRFYDLLFQNNIRISAFASPLFKWYPDGITDGSPEKVDTFGFNPYLSIEDKKQYIVKAIKVAKTLHTENVRIFSTLRGGTISYSLVQDPLFEFALKEASKEGVTLMLENEPPCYIHRMENIKKIARKYASRNLKIWFDVSNFYKVADSVSLKDLQDLRVYIGYFHLKDFNKAGDYVPLGTGVINYKRVISDIRNTLKDTDVFLSVETHVRSDPKGATTQSVATLRELIDKKRIGYGVAGCGQVFSKHGSAIAENPFSELRAVFDINGKRTREAAEQYDCEAKPDLDAILNDKTIDVLNIRTPNDTHVQLALAALSRGKKVLCEKPLCLTTAEGKKILAHKKYNKNVFVNFQNRYNPAVEQLFEYAKSGKLGKILSCSVDVRWWRDDKYFRDWHGDRIRVGGILYNQGVHALDLMLQLCGQPKTVKTMSTSLRKNSKLEDLFLSLVKFKNGALGNIEVTTYVKHRNCEATIFVIGEKGSIKLGGPSFNKIEFLSLQDSQAESAGLEYASQEATENSHHRLVQAINKLLLEKKKDKNIAFAEDGVAVTAFIEKLYRSK